MARLEFEITGDSTGLENAADRAEGILEGLQKVADGLKINLFQATTVSDINNVGAALTGVTNQIKNYVNEAVKTSQAWQDQTAANTLDSLSAKLLAVTGNAQLFGTTIKSQQAEINAYQAAISRLLSAGLDPMSATVQNLKGKIDDLTASINAQNQVAAQSKFTAQFQNTGSLVLDAQAKVDRLGTALRSATDERSIIQYNVRLVEAQRELDRLKTLGLSASQATAALATSGGRVSQTFTSVGTEFSRIIQDAPFAFKALGAGQDNFGAIGNNITRLVELIPSYIAQTSAVIVANGGIATSANVAKASLAGLFTGFNGILLGISLVVSAFTIYQAVQQRNAREASNHVDLLQKQKKALDDYVSTLDAASRAGADAANSYGLEVAKLDQLFGAIQNNTKARYDNGTAVQELQKAYPDVFGSLKENEFLTLKAAAAYEKLRDGIISSAVAASATKLAGKATDDYVTNTIALQGATERVTVSQQKYNAALKVYDDLRFGGKGTSAGGNGNYELDSASQAAGIAKNELDAAKESVMDYRAAIFKAQQAVSNYNKVAIDAFAQDKQPKKSGILYNLEQQLDQLQKLRPTIKVQAELDLNTKQIKSVQDKIDKLGGTKGTKKSPVDTSAQNQNSFANQLRNIADKSNNSASTASLQGYEEQKQKIENTYKGLYADLNSLEDKLTANTKINGDQRIKDLQAIAATRKQLTVNQTAELSALQVNEAQRVANEITRINDEFGVKSEVTKNKELAVIQARYDAEVVKARGNADILKTLDADRLVAIQAINDKYAGIENDLYQKIGAIETSAKAESAGKEESQTQKIRTEWENRRREANKYYDELKKLQDNSFFDPSGLLSSGSIKGIQALSEAPINAKQDQTNAQITKAENAAVAAENAKVFNQEFDRAIKSLGSSFSNTLNTIGQEGNRTFSEIISNFGDDLTKTLQSTIVKIATDYLGNALKKGITNGLNSALSGLTSSSAGISTGVTNSSAAGALGAVGGLASLGGTALLLNKGGTSTAGATGATKSGGISASTGIAAGAVVAGGIVQSVTPKTSSVGQAAGGALKGAGTGALIGSVIPGIGTAVGAVVGGLIGGISGLFGAAKARKEQAAQAAAALAEAQKQTALLRQQALAYTASVIGKMTTNGVVTGVDINGFGELTAKVSGKDLQFVLDRNSNSR